METTGSGAPIVQALTHPAWAAICNSWASDSSLAMGEDIPDSSKMLWLHCGGQKFVKLLRGDAVSISILADDAELLHGEKLTLLRWPDCEVQRFARETIASSWRRRRHRGYGRSWGQRPVRQWRLNGGVTRLSSMRTRGRGK